MSEARALARKAKEIIGAGDPDRDWKISPTEHAEKYKDTPLAEILLDPLPSGLAEHFEERDKEAVEARDTFKDLVRKSNNAVFATAGLGALLLAASGLDGWLGQHTSPLLATIGGLGVVSSGLATMWLRRLKEQDRLTAWSQARARAEAKRLAYFKAVMAGTSKEPSDRVLTLEYVRRYLLDSQIYYFKKRGGIHLDKADKTVETVSLSVLLASCATAAAGSMAWYWPELVALAAFGVISTAFAARAKSQSEVNLDRKNADRYRSAQLELEEWKLGSGTYHARLAAGSGEALQDFFKPVFVLLAADHRSFLEDDDAKEIALDAIEDRMSVDDTDEDAPEVAKERDRQA